MLIGSACRICRNRTRGLDANQTMLQNALVRFGDLALLASRGYKAHRVFAHGRELSEAARIPGKQAAKIAHARVTPSRKSSMGFSFVRVLCGVYAHRVLVMGSVSRDGQHAADRQPSGMPHKALASGSVRSRTDTRVTPMKSGHRKSDRPSIHPDARRAACQRGTADASRQVVRQTAVRMESLPHGYSGLRERKNQPGEGRKPALSPLGNQFQRLT